MLHDGEEGAECGPAARLCMLLFLLRLSPVSLASPALSSDYALSLSVNYLTFFLLSLSVFGFVLHLCVCCPSLPGLSLIMPSFIRVWMT